jgi:hypothetical protein
MTLDRRKLLLIHNITYMYPAWYINVGLSVLLQGLLFWRGFRCALGRHYPFFYTYLTYTAVRSIAVSLPLVIRHSSFSKVYWWSHTLAAILRFGIAAEIHRHVFPHDSPIRRRAEVAVLCVLALLALLFWIGGAGPGHYILDVLRKIALSVAVWILVVLGLAHYYGIRIGRNVWGMAIGLLTFTGSELVNLAAMDLLPRLRNIWEGVHPIAFVSMLMVWTSALWRFYPNPQTPSLDKSSAENFLNAWQGRWTQVPNVIRRVVKP